MNRVIYVGIAGKKFHGKDTFARFVREWLEARGVEVRRRGFSDALKEEVADFLVPHLLNAPHWNVHSPESLRSTLLDIFNYGGKETKEQFRLVLQWWGVEFRRQTFNPDYWLRMLELWVAEELHRAKKDLVVLVPDLRMPNECDFIKNAGGLLVKVVRPGMDSGDQHATETALDGYDDWDSFVRNGLDLSALEDMAHDFCRSHLEWRL